VISAAGALAQNRVIERYIYDAAGNIVGIETVEIEGPPEVDSIVPDRVFAGSRRTFEISGQNLLGAQVQSSLPGLSIDALESAPNLLRFDLVATAEVALGPTDLTVNTLSGTDAVSIIVRPELPDLVAQPIPLVVAADGGNVSLEVTLREPASTDWVLDVDVDDPAVASASLVQIPLQPGQQSISGGIPFIGGTAGSTPFRISTEGAPLLEANLFSTPFGDLPAGDWRFESGVLGVRKETPVRLIDRGPIIGSLRVVRPAEEDSAPFYVDIAGPRLGVGRGPVLFDVQPETVSRDVPEALLVLNGFGLDAVDTVRIVPPEGIVVDLVEADASGDTVSVHLRIDPAAESGLRRVIASTASAAVAPMEPAADRFYLAGELPRIDSITPSSVEPGQAFELIVRGQNFSPTSQVLISPSGGLELDMPIEISADQTTIRASVRIAPDAALGPRLVQVRTSAGASSAALSGANTLNVLEPGLVTFSPVVSQVLGVDRGGSGTGFEAFSASPALGAARGPVLAELEPRIVEAGASPVLLGLGSGLDAIESVVIEPSDGIVVSGPVTSPDAIEFSLAIAPSAERGVRAMRFLTADGVMPVARPELRAVRVVSPQPLVEAISPVYVEPGAGPVELIIRGVNFQQAESVAVIPQADLQLGGFSVSLAGDEIRLPVSADADAAIGPRVVQVTTPAGSSPSAQTNGNRFYVGDPRTRLVTPLVAPHLGVRRDALPGSNPVTRASPTLGVERPIVEAPATLDVESHAGARKIVRGRTMLEIQPSILPQGFAGDLIMPGIGLGLDIEVALDNGDGITLTGAPVVELDGGGNPFVRVPLVVDADAPITRHRVRLAEPDAGGGASIEIPFLDPSKNQLRVAGPAPVIQSIEPIITLSDQTIQLLIRGFNLAGASEVRVIPDQGISVGTQLDINADGTSLTVAVDVTAGAEPGPRLIQVVGPAGTSGEVANATNTLTVVEP